MSSRSLDGMLVVDLSTGLGGAYCSKLLADLGARVIVVEPTEGSALRTWAAEGRAWGGPWAHLSAGKESAAPVDAESARLLLSGLSRAADIVILDQDSHWRSELPTTLPERVVRVEMSPWGSDGPYAGWRGSDIATWAMGGYMFFTGDPDGWPLMLPGGQSELHAGVHAAIAAMTAIRERRRSGHGQTVEISALEANLSAHAWLISSWIASGLPLNRVPHDFTRTQDGWALFMRAVPNPNIFLLIGQPERMESVEITNLDEWRGQLAQLYADVEEWAQDHDSVEVATLAQELRIACTPVLDAKGLDENIQLATRDWWEQGEDAEWGDLRFPGPAYLMSRTPAERGGPAPAPGAHTESLAEEFSETPAPSPPPAMATTDLPLAGMRVVELTSNWAGPIVGRHLGDLGADVVKLEWAARPATRALFMPGPTQDPQRYPYDRAMYFNLLNRNKRDLIVDLSADEGKQIFMELMREADVFVENNSARVMPNLGLDYETVRAVNERIVYVSMSGFGATGPWRDWSAYGSNIEASSGLASVTGYDADQVRRTPLFYADPVSGNHATVAILAALEHRDETGEGQYIDVALNEAGAAYFFESLMHYQTTGRIMRPNGNGDARFAPQGAYRAMGEDTWIAVSVQSDEEWRSLCRALRRDDLLADSGLATLEGRTARQDELDQAIEAWSNEREQYEAAWELQRAGVSAAPILANWQVLHDPHIHERGFYRWVNHSVIGVYPYPSWPWRFGRTEPSIRRAAPRFAEHNHEVLTELGYDDEQIAELYALEITSDVPTAPLLIARGGFTSTDD
ncbi:MAG: CoA transferase [Chloroflexi bacterium]|nr:CoA transferase [Chloroflexota bacterium]MYF81140.1 CoA transferase [Chloroflexota bacterium]MYI04050.1 CoA transferase [Chloroflexota bacterium]